MMKSCIINSIQTEKGLSVYCGIPQSFQDEVRAETDRLLADVINNPLDYKENVHTWAKTTNARKEAGENYIPSTIFNVNLGREDNEEDMEIAYNNKLIFDEKEALRKSLAKGTYLLMNVEFPEIIDFALNVTSTGNGVVQFYNTVPDFKSIHVVEKVVLVAKEDRKPITEEARNWYKSAAKRIK